jgi:hypothetical protein
VLCGSNTANESAGEAWAQRAGAIQPRSGSHRHIRSRSLAVLQRRIIDTYKAIV